MVAHSFWNTSNYKFISCSLMILLNFIIHTYLKKVIQLIEFSFFSFISKSAKLSKALFPSNRSLWYLLSKDIIMAGADRGVQKDESLRAFNWYYFSAGIRNTGAKRIVLRSICVFLRTIIAFESTWATQVFIWKNIV